MITRGLRKKQSDFLRMIADLIIFAYDSGYELTAGDAYRDPRVHGVMGEHRGYGHSRSFHKTRLAMDLNLFKDGEYLSDTDDHRFLGEHWKSLHPDNTWGGDFRNADGNHYSHGEGR